MERALLYHTFSQIYVPDPDPTSYISPARVKRVVESASTVFQTSADRIFPVAGEGHLLQYNA